MATLDNSSGKYQGTKRPKPINTRAKAAMMTALDRHRKYVPQSQKYYEKKRAQGKSHNQAIRALGRHLCRIIYKMLKEKREYEVRPLKRGHLEIVAYRANREEKNLGERIKSQSNKRREEKSPHRLKISSGTFGNGSRRERLSPSPPSEPCVRFSRTRLSSRWFPHRDWLANTSLQ